MAPCAEGMLFLVQKAEIGRPGGTITGLPGVTTGGVDGFAGAGINVTVTLNWLPTCAAKLGKDSKLTAAAHAKAGITHIQFLKNLNIAVFRE